MKRVLWVLAVLLLPLLVPVVPAAASASIVMPAESRLAEVRGVEYRMVALVNDSDELFLHFLTHSYTEEGKSVYTHVPEKTRRLMENVDSIVACDRELFILQRDGSLWVQEESYLPTPVLVLENVRKIRANGYYHCSAVTDTGELYDIDTWTKKSYDPTLGVDNYVITWKDSGVTEIGSGSYIKDNAFWGYSNTSPEPKMSREITVPGAARIWSYKQASFLLTDTGALYSWGYNLGGRLGNGGLYNQKGPMLYLGDGLEAGVYSVQIINTEPTKILDDVTGLWLGDNYLCAEKADGTFWQWGDGENIMAYTTQTSEDHYTQGDYIYPDAFARRRLYPRGRGPVPVALCRKPDAV